MTSLKLDRSELAERSAGAGRLAPRTALGFAVLALVVGSADLAVAGNPGDLVLNEFNACSDVSFLRDEGSDPFLGRVQGNGGNWVELVVISDHLDIRGWTLQWRNADPDSGSVIFVDHPIWSDLRSGTLITIREDDLSPPGFGVLLTDLSYDPAQGDYWIHANVDDFTVVSQFGFKVDDDDWEMRILDESPTIIQDWVGESTPLWGGTGGVASDELGKLEEDPSAAAAITPPPPNYDDGTSSTFASENRWSSAPGVTVTQDFCDLRGDCQEPPPAMLPALSANGLALSAVVILGLALWGIGARGWNGVPRR